jgi:hypothetical protein
MDDPEECETAGRVIEQRPVVLLGDDPGLPEDRVALQRVAAAGVDLLDERGVQTLVVLGVCVTECAAAHAEGDGEDDRGHRKVCRRF